MKQAAKQAIIRKNNFNHNTLVALLKLDGVRKQTSFLQNQFIFGSWHTMAHHLIRKYPDGYIKDLASQLCQAPNDLTTPIIYSMGMKTISAWTPMHQIMCAENSRDIQPIINLFNQNGENQKEFIKIMGIKTNIGWTPMHLMMGYQTNNDYDLGLHPKPNDEIHGMVYQVLAIFNQDVTGRKQLCTRTQSTIEPSSSKTYSYCFLRLHATTNQSLYHTSTTSG